MSAADDEAGTTAGTRTARATLGLLTTVAAFGFLAYALLLPAFEGPDEPFHLSRALDFARGRFADGWRADHLGDDVVSAISRYPCGPDLHRAFGCPTFPTDPGRAWGNLLTAPVAGSPPDPREPYPNYERQHPVLGYLIWAVPVAVVDRATSDLTPIRRVTFAQLTIRMTNLALLAMALLGPGRRLVASWSFEARAVALGVLLIPAGVETLARGGLEALVFAWSVWFVEASARAEPKTSRVVALAAIGPLVKLTAVPVIALAALVAWSRKRRGVATGIVGAGALVYLERLLRGYLAGGVLDLHGSYASHDPGGALDVIEGIGWSMLVTVKSAAWLGGWSFFRPPLWVLALIAAAAIVLLRHLRPTAETDRAWRVAGIGAAGVAIAGHAVFSLAVYRVFGSWAVGGWYVWAWFPAAAFAAERTLEWRRPLPAWLWPATGAALAAVDLAWLRVADRLYG
jgi:hypothetical protein